MDKPTIEKDVPLPSHKPLGNYKWPFAEMGVGDSFFVPANTTEEKRRIQMNVMGSCRRFRDKGRFATRRVEGGVRVWRIE